MAFLEAYFGPNGPDEKTELFNASSFLGFLRRSHPDWQLKNKQDELQHWVFRGHWDARWRLVPSAARPLVPQLNTEKENQLKQIIEHRKSLIDTFWKPVDSFDYGNDVAAYIAAYAEAMRQFMLLGNQIGFIDEPAMEDILSQKILAQELSGAGQLSLLLAHCSLDKGMAPHVRSKYPGNSAPITALAQHHGIPTFLLDWTENPWIAAFFASDSPEEFKDEHDICVWGLNIDKIEGGMGEISRLNNLGGIRVNRPPKSKNIYLSSQAGLMTFLSDDRGIWRNTGSYPGLEEIISRWTSEGMQTEGFYSQFPEHIENQKSAIKTYFSEEVPIIRKVVLAKEHLPTLRKLLRLEGITRAHLMPTYDNLAETSLSFAKMDALNLGRT